MILVFSARQCYFSVTPSNTVPVFYQRTLLPEETAEGSLSAYYLFNPITVLDSSGYSYPCLNYDRSTVLGGTLTWLLARVIESFHTSAHISAEERPVTNWS